MLENSGVEPEAGLEPATLRLFLIKSHTLYRLSYPGDVVVLDWERGKSYVESWMDGGGWEIGECMGIGEVRKRGRDGEVGW